MIKAYVAHPLGPDGPQREANRARGARWSAWIARTFKVATVADWIILSGEWEESEENRKLGLEIDCALIEGCGAIFLTGGRVSPGMQIEHAHAVKTGLYTVDFSMFEEPTDVPEDMIDIADAALDALEAAA